MTRPEPWLPAAHTEGEALAYRKGYAAGVRAGKRQFADKLTRAWLRPKLTPRPGA